LSDSNVHFSIEPSINTVNKLARTIMDDIKQKRIGNGSNPQMITMLHGRIRYYTNRTGKLRIHFDAPTEPNVTEREFVLAAQELPSTVEGIKSFLKFGLRLVNAAKVVQRVAIGELGRINFSKCTADHPLIIPLQHGHQAVVFRESKTTLADDGGRIQVLHLVVKAFRNPGNCEDRRLSDTYQVPISTFDLSMGGL